MLKEYESITKNVLFGNAVLAALMSGRKYDVITLNANCSERKQCPYFGFAKEVHWHKLNVVTELSTFIYCSPTLVEAI